MLKMLWKKVVAIFSPDEESDEESRFIPSELDKSVIDAHGGSRQDIARELEDIERQAEVLDEEERHE